MPKEFFKKQEEVITEEDKMYSMKPTPYRRHHYLVVITNDITHCSNTIILYLTKSEVRTILNQFNDPEKRKMTQMHMTMNGKDENYYNEF